MMIEQILSRLPDHEIKTQSLMAYALMLKGEYSRSKEILEGLLTNVINYKLFEKGLVLWAVAEYVYKSEDDHFIITNKEIMDALINALVKGWDQPSDYWLEDMPRDIYTVNIAIVYGAFTSLENVYAHNVIIKKEKIKIRKFLFDNLLHGGNVTSVKGENKIFGDLIVMAVPFAYLDAGNQILIKSLDYIEANLHGEGCKFSQELSVDGGSYRSDLTCWFAWYYAEKGDIPKAKKFLNYAEEMQQKADGKFLTPYLEECYISYPLYLIAQERIAFKEGVDGSTDSIQIIHSTKGTGNPYKLENDELFPREPIEGEDVYVRALTQPFNEAHKMYVNIKIEDELKRKEMLIKESKDGEKYWECPIGSFRYGEQVNYQFVLQTKEVEIESKAYEFNVLKWVAVDNIIGYKKYTDHVDLYLVQCNDHVIILNMGIDAGHCRTSLRKELSNNQHHMCHEDALLQIGQYTIEIKDQQLYAIRFKDQSLATYNEKNKSALEICIDQFINIHKFKLNFCIQQDEKFYGMGERYSHIQYRGHIVENYVYNQYRDQGLKTYIPLPFLMSSKGYGMFINTSMYFKVDFGATIDNLLSLEVDIINNALEYYLLFGEAKAIINEYTQIIGPPQLPPKWSFGPWMSSNNWDTEEEVRRQIQLTQDYEIPATVCVIEQWSDEATFYIFNDAQYEPISGSDHFKYEDFIFPNWGRWPHPKEMIRDIHEDGLKVLLWQAPVQKFMDGINHVQRDIDEKIMIEKGYCVMGEDGSPYRIPSFEWFKGSLVPDFTWDEASKWWLDKRKYLLEDMGIDGFKTDGGECIYGEETLFKNGKNGLEMRSEYPNSYIGAYHTFTEQYIPDGITFSRSGYLGAHRIPIHWAGDEVSTFKAFRSSIRAGLSIGLSGIPIWGWDLGGFHGDIPTDELFLRATQMATFCPIMQYHAETKGEFNQDRTPWNIADRTGNQAVISIYKFYADLRMNLLPYIWQEAKKSCNTGLPMMRALIMHDSNDPLCQDIDNQYMFGDSLLIAPVVEEGASRRQLYLPSGSWLQLFNGEAYEGGRFIEQDADITSIPVYLKEDSILPLNLGEGIELGSHIGNQVDDYTHLTFMLYVNHKVDYLFKDGDIEIAIEAAYNNNRLNLNVISNCEKKIHFIIRNARDNIEVQYNEEIDIEIIKRYNENEEVIYFNL